ncbi:callose synthase 3-like [Dorcoceras hygrometricum]|uniref:Callose synthase 3-like n=1 Tax=Dorcoceras hygrometricum TaxID=472368 RepID=A0A2Z7CHT8_9LAMI|nr:callose synthase 3-like [Dorcoceras hygrometricum]
MTSAVMSSQSAGSYQQMRREVKEMKRRRAEESADGLALMTSLVTSSYSADGLSPAVARYQQIQQMIFALITSRKIPVASYSRYQSQASLLLYIQSTWYPDARKAKVAKLLKIQQMLFALITSRKIPVASYSRYQSQASLLLYIQSTWYPDARKAKVVKLGKQTQATAHPVESFYEPAVATQPVASSMNSVDKDFSRR